MTDIPRLKELEGWPINRRWPAGRIISLPGSQAIPFGLTEEEAQERRRQGQGNEQVKKAGRSYFEIIRANLLTFFNLVLLSLGLLLVMLGQLAEAFFTTGIAIVNLVIAVNQEIQAKRKLDQIALLTRPKAIVVRDGELKRVDPDEIVLGDVLLVEPGDQIVVDGRMVGQGSMEVDESMLSGESDPVHKEPGDLVYSGSYCVSGRAFFEATEVGDDSFANRLAAQARAFTSRYTPLQREVNLVIRVLLAVVVYFAIMLTVGSIINERPLVENVRNTSVLFGLAPSSLFLMVVVAYAVAAVRMAGKGALVQQINSVESLCHVDLICLDKTGTLTTNRLKLEHLDLLDDSLDEMALRFTLGDYVANATTGNRTTRAIADACPGQARLVIDEASFSSERKWSGLVFDDPKLSGTYCLGAPEILAPNLVGQHELSCRVEKWAAQGLRVLLFTFLPEIAPLRPAHGSPRLPDGQIPLCLICFREELRDEARQTLEGLAKAGIQQKIISGDSPATVEALAKQAGFNQGRTLEVVSGLQLATMNEGELYDTVRRADIYGRITPEQKEQLIQIFRRQGHYVAMTGDGVNDVLALKQANLGIAMQSGSQATRSVADIILLNDSFGALPNTLTEGQRILNGMQDVMKLYFMRILNLTLLVTAIAIIGVGFPFTPTQGAFVSALTLSAPSFALTLWARPGPLPEGGMVRKLIHFVIPAVVTTSIAGLAVYLYFILLSRAQTGVADVVYAQQALTYTLTTCGIILLIFVEPPTEFWAGGDEICGDWRPTILSGLMFLALVLFIVVPPMRAFYQLSVLEPADYLIIAGVTIVWTFTLRYTWKARLLERYLGVEALG